MPARYFREALKNLKVVVGEFGAPIVTHASEAGEADAGQQASGCVLGQVSRKSEGCGIKSQREVAARFDEARPVDPRIDQESRRERVDLIDRKSPVEALQTVGGGGIVDETAAEIVATLAVTEILAGVEKH